MATTIQISEETKKKLFMIMNQLEKQWGRRVTYDEAIKFLLHKEKLEINRKEFLKNIKKYQGMLESDEGKEILKGLREQEHEREQRYI
jgi:hypothetical protein